MIRYPDPRGEDPEVLRWMAELIRILEQRDQQVSAPAGTYSTSNVTKNRTIDADTIILTDLADVVGTLVEDMQDQEVGGLTK